MRRSRGRVATLAVLSALVLFLPAGSQAADGADAKAIQELSARTPRVPMPSLKAKALSTWLAEKKNVLIVDVRAAGAFQQDHLEGAVNFPLVTLPDRYQELPLDRVLLLVDEDGTTTLLAGSYLKRKGIRETVRLFGGMEAWRLQGSKKKK